MRVREGRELGHRAPDVESPMAELEAQALAVDEGRLSEESEEPVEHHALTDAAV